jgi:hypothetical protein
MFGAPGFLKLGAIAGCFLLFHYSKHVLLIRIKRYRFHFLVSTKEALLTVRGQKT